MGSYVRTAQNNISRYVNEILERNPIVILTNIYLNNKRIDFNDMYIEMVEMALNVILIKNVMIVQHVL